MKLRRMNSFFIRLVQSFSHYFEKLINDDKNIFHLKRFILLNSFDQIQILLLAIDSFSLFTGVLSLLLYYYILDPLYDIHCPSDFINRSQNTIRYSNSG